jgi:4-amino-4-deoxy-L-arabinose transferase-like glycosyltransferase
MPKLAPLALTAIALAGCHGGNHTVRYDDPNGLWVVLLFLAVVAFIAIAAIYIFSSVGSYSTQSRALALAAVACLVVVAGVLAAGLRFPATVPKEGDPCAPGKDPPAGFRCEER